MKKKVYQKPIAISPADMIKVEALQEEWTKLTGLVVKKTDVVRALLLIANTTPERKLQALLSNSKEWYK